MLQNAYLVAKIGIDTAENEPPIKSDVSWPISDQECDTASDARPSASRMAHSLRRRRGASPPAPPPRSPRCTYDRPNLSLVDDNRKVVGILSVLTKIGFDTADNEPSKAGECSPRA